MGRRQMHFSRFLLLASLMLCLLQGFEERAFAQGMGAPPTASLPAEKKKKPKKDPILSAALTPIPIDDETKAALARSKEPGVLLAAEFTKGNVAEIRLVGARKIEPDALITQLKTHINRPFDAAIVPEDIRRLFATGIFSEISVDKEEVKNGALKLTFLLKEKPTLFKVKFEGNDAISEDDLKEAIDLEAFHVADNFRIKENADKIRKLYSDKGYFLVGVRYRLEKVKDDDLEEPAMSSLHPDYKDQPKIKTPKVVAPDFMNVVFMIDEDAKIKIERVSFSGNEHFPAAVLKETIFSKENHPLGVVSNWGTFSEEMNEGDVYMLEKFYQDRGYLNVLIGKPGVGVSEDKTRVSVHFPITEGDQFFLGDLQIKGDFVVDEVNEANDDDEDATPQFERDKLLSQIMLKHKEVFNRSVLAQNVLGIAERYRDQGYAYANINPETKVNEEDKTVDVVLNVDAGPRVTIERIDVKGNYKSADEVVRRELRVYEGERYSSSLLRLSEIRLNQLGYFEKVKLSQKEGSANDKMVIEVELEERKTGSFSVGGGYGTGGEGLLFQSQIQQNNLFGRGQSLIGTVQWSGFRRIFDIRFVDPYLTYVGESPLTLSLAAFNTERYLGDFSRSSTGGEITFGYPIGHPLFGLSRAWMRNADMWAMPFIPDFENLRLFASYGIERVEINQVGLGVSLFGLHSLQPRYTTAIKPTLQLDQRNDRIFPSAGYFIELRTEFASYALGSQLLANLEKSLTEGAATDGISGGRWFVKPPAGTNNYFRFGGNARFYYNFDRWLPISGFVLRLNLDLGIMNTSNEQLVSENYRMGGVGVGNLTGLRGYTFQSVGPILSVGRDRERQNVYEFVLGGNKQALLNLELEIPIIKSMKLNGVLFFDMGNVYSPRENLFYAGGTRDPYYTSNFSDPLGTFYNLGLFSSIGFGFRWFSPMAPIRFEFGFPLVRRPAGTPGTPFGDASYQVEFNIGQSF